MKRFVTYIYEYERGVKGRNTGFIKADIRGNDCRMEMHLRGLNGIRGKGKVYVLVKKQDLIGIGIGEIMLNGGKGDFRTMFRVNPIQDTAFGFQDIVGVSVTYGGGQLSASQWRGEEPMSFTVSDIQIWEDSQVQAERGKAESAATSEPGPDIELQAALKEPSADTKTLNASEPGRQTDAAGVREPGRQTDAAEVREPGHQTDAAGAAEPGHQTDAAEAAESGRQADAAGVRELERQIEEAAVEEPARQADVAAEKVLLSRGTEETRNAEPLSAAEEKLQPVSDPVLEAHAAARAKNIFPDNISLASKWEELQPNHQAVSLASENQGSWIRMEIKELRDLPKRFWYLGNNSFLLHGFLNYHHILFGKEETEQGTMWYLGVPGVFQKEERVMATLFGFSGFCPITGKPSEGGFGYWMHTLEKS